MPLNIIKAPLNFQKQWFNYIKHPAHCQVPPEKPEGTDAAGRGADEGSRSRANRRIV